MSKRPSNRHTCLHSYFWQFNVAICGIRLRMKYFSGRKGSPQTHSYTEFSPLDSIERHPEEAKYLVLALGKDRTVK